MKRYSLVIFAAALCCAGIVCEAAEIAGGSFPYSGKKGRFGEEKKALVAFDTVGNKTLLLKFAKLIIPK